MADGVAQVVERLPAKQAWGPDFKPHCHQKKKKKKKSGVEWKCVVATENNWEFFLENI
jgi:hypothetical protein